MRFLRAAALLVLIAPTAALGQASSASTFDRSQAISFSPILALFEILQAEYEVRVGPEMTAGLGVGYWNFGDEEEDDEVGYLAVDLKGRFYPDRAFEGFSIGGSIGAARIDYVTDSDSTEAETTGFTFGVEVGRAWLLGDENRFILTTGIGAKRYWFDVEEDDDVPVVLPTGRLGFGIAF